LLLQSGATFTLSQQQIENVVENSKTVSHCGNKGERGFPLGNGKQDGERPKKQENEKEREREAEK
jgi:hypothetical protein